MLCDSCAQDAILHHDANHALLVLLDDALLEHSVEATFPQLDKSQLMWLPVHAQAHSCYVCDADIVSKMYLSLVHSERWFCHRCYINTIQQDKRCALIVDCCSLKLPRQLNTSLPVVRVGKRHLSARSRNRA